MSGQKDSITDRILPSINPLKKQQSRETDVIIPIFADSLRCPMLPIKNPNPIPIIQPTKEVIRIIGSDVPNSIFRT